MDNGSFTITRHVGKSTIFVSAPWVPSPEEAFDIVETVNAAARELRWSWLRVLGVRLKKLVTNK